MKDRGDQEMVVKEPLVARVNFGAAVGEIDSYSDARTTKSQVVSGTKYYEYLVPHWIIEDDVLPGAWIVVPTGHGYGVVQVRELVPMSQATWDGELKPIVDSIITGNYEQWVSAKQRYDVLRKQVERRVKDAIVQREMAEAAKGDPDLEAMVKELEKLSKVARP